MRETPKDVQSNGFGWLACDMWTLCVSGEVAAVAVRWRKSFTSRMLRSLSYSPVGHGSTGGNSRPGRLWPSGKWQVTRCYGRNCLREQDFRAFERSSDLPLWQVTVASDTADCYPQPRFIEPSPPVWRERWRVTADTAGRVKREVQQVGYPCCTARRAR